MTIDLQSVPGCPPAESRDIVYVEGWGPHHFRWFMREFKKLPGPTLPGDGPLTNQEKWLVTPRSEWYCAVAIAGDRIGGRASIEDFCKSKNKKLAVIEGSQLVIEGSERVELTECRLVYSDERQMPPKSSGPGDIGVTLLTMKQIQQRLNEEFGPLVPMLGNGYTLQNGGVSEEECVECEHILGVRFPPEFRRAIQTFYFGDLTIGPLFFFSRNGNYLQDLIESNNAHSEWPEHVLLIAGSDPYAFLLDTTSGAVMSLDPDRDSIAHIAGDFDSFIRGVATAMALRRAVPDKRMLALGLREAVGGADLGFWQFMTH